MPGPDTQPSPDEPTMHDAAVFIKADLAHVFGPSFFLGHLRRFVLDQCPDPLENLPTVRIHLADGATLDVCHIVGVAPRWVMLAVREEGTDHGEMALELVPYDIIQRVYIGSRHAEGTSIGFVQKHVPAILSPETLLRSAMEPAGTVR